MNNIILNPQQKFFKELIVRCINKETTTREVAMDTGFIMKTIQKKIRDYKKYGDKVFVHGNTGKKKPRKKYELMRSQIADIFLNTRINGINPFVNITYANFRSILLEEYNIKTSKTWLKTFLNSLGYKTPIRHKVKKEPTHIMRERKEHMGELVQADGTPYDWFMNGHKTCIQGFIDDATGYPTGLYMTPNECLLGYTEAFRIMAIRHGIPQTVYPDKASVFFVNKKHDDGKRHLTQFGAMMEHFGVEMFPAHSPQAKGRIERFWQTIQHRLPNIFALKGIDTIEKANEYLSGEFLEKYKQWFPVQPKSDESYFVEADMSQINSVLKASFPGKTDAGGVFLLKGYRFLLPELPKRKVVIYLNEKEGLWVEDFQNPGKRYNPILLEADTMCDLSEATHDLIDRTFMKTAKPKFREVYTDIDDVVYDDIMRKRSA